MGRIFIICYSPNSTIYVIVNCVSALIVFLYPDNKEIQCAKYHNSEMKRCRTLYRDVLRRMEWGAAVEDQVQGPVPTSISTNTTIVHRQFQPQPQPHPTQQWFTTNSNLNLKHNNSSQPISTSTPTRSNIAMVHNQFQPHLQAQPWFTINVNLNHNHIQHNHGSQSMPTSTSISTNVRVSPLQVKVAKLVGKNGCFKDSCSLHFMGNSCTFMEFFKHIFYLEVINFQRFSNSVDCMPIMMLISFEDSCIWA